MRTHVLSPASFMTLVAVAFVFVFCARPANAQGQEAPPALVNIEIFTDLTYAQVREQMTMIRDQLGARCRYCHLVGPDDVTDYVPDTNMKRIARQMIRMVQVVNDQEPFRSGDKKVTCATCHKGSPHISFFVPGGRETWVPRD